VIPSIAMLAEQLHDPAAGYSSAWLYDIDPYDRPHGDELQEAHRQQSLRRAAERVEAEATK
jgi:hypothetical protein